MPTPSTVTVAARLDRLPQSRYIRRLIILLSLGGCCEFYDLFFSAYIAPALYQSGIFTPTTRGFLGMAGFASFIASLFAGLFVGALFFSPLSDRFGRRTMFSYSLLWYSVCTFIMAFQSTAMAIDLWRFIAGLGIGVELITIDTYVSELVPHASRGRAFAFNQAISFTAVPFAALVSWILVPVRIAGLDGWRWVALIGASGAIFMWFIRRELPESPRWLEQQGQHERANRLMTQMEDRVRAETSKELPPPRTVEGEQVQDKGSWMEMWNVRYRKRTIMLTAFHLFETLGYYGFANWVPTLLLAKGINVTSTLRFTFLIALASPVGPLLGLAFADRFERKWQVAWSALLLGVFGLLFAQQQTAVGVIAFGILTTLSSNWLSFSYHAYQSELYPTRIRARAVGVRLFLEPLQRHRQQLCHCLCAAQLWDAGRVCIDSFGDGGGLRDHRRVRAAHQPAAPGRDRPLSNPWAGGTSKTMELFRPRNAIIQRKQYQDKMAATIGPNDQSEDELLRRARTGDAEAFTTIYRRCQGPVFRFALHMSGSRPVAEDVTQEVFMALIANRCSFDSLRGTLKAYLLGVARHLMLRRLEKERSFVSLPENEASPNGLPGTNGHGHGNLTVLQPDPVRAETIGLVRDAVLSLPANYREIVVLCDLQEMSYEEAARIMDCAVGTVRSRLHRARALLMEKLRDTCGAEDRVKMMRIV